MSKSVAFGITLVAGIAAFFLSYALWPNPPGADQPSSGLVPFYIIESAGESVAFGLGLAFLLRGAQRSMTGRTRSTWRATSVSADYWRTGGHTRTCTGSRASIGTA